MWLWILSRMFLVIAFMAMCVVMVCVVKDFIEMTSDKGDDDKA